MKILCFIFLQFVAVMAVAESSPNDCLQGVWQFDTDDSDNPEKLLKKLQRKQRRQEEVLRNGRPMYDSEKEDLSLSNIIPGFVFLTDDINLVVTSDKVDVFQQHLNRSLSLQASHSLSLVNLNNNSNSMVAGWENGVLVVETSSPNGAHVTETFTLKQDDVLHVMMTVTHPFEKAKTVIEKVYRRKGKSPQNCS
jgi:hypothetical protein